MSNNTKNKQVSYRDQNIFAHISGHSHNILKNHVNICLVNRL